MAKSSGKVNLAFEQGYVNVRTGPTLILMEFKADDFPLFFFFFSPNTQTIFLHQNEEIFWTVRTSIRIVL